MTRTKTPKPTKPLTQHERAAKDILGIYHPLETYVPVVRENYDIKAELIEGIRRAFALRNNAPLKLPEHLRQGDDVYARRGVDFLTPQGVWFYGWDETDISYGKFDELHLFYNWLQYVRANPLPYDPTQYQDYPYSDKWYRLYYNNPPD